MRDSSQSEEISHRVLFPSGSELVRQVRPDSDPPSYLPKLRSRVQENLNELDQGGLIFSERTSVNLAADCFSVWSLKSVTSKTILHILHISIYEVTGIKTIGIESYGHSLATSYNF